MGAKGSPLQLILSSVYQIDAPTGNIPLKEALRICKHRTVAEGIPLAYGDSYQGFRLVGTDERYVKAYAMELESGQLNESDFEVCIGATVAKRSGLKLGDTFFSAHGLINAPEELAHTHEEQAYTVKGIFKSSGSALDHLILTNVASIWRIHETHDHDHGDGHGHDEHEHSEATQDQNHDHGHSHDHHDHSHDHAHGGHDHSHEAAPKARLAPMAYYEQVIADEPDKEITAMLVRFKSKLGIVQVPRIVNQQTSMQAALPAIEMNRLFDRLGLGINVLRGVAIAIILISAISVFISLYRSLKERAYEMALMRVMGASPTQLFTLVLFEGLILSAIGFLLGIVLSRFGLWLLTKWGSDDLPYSLSIFSWHPQETWLLFATLFIGILAALIPAVQASRTDIANKLAQ